MHCVCVFAPTTAMMFTFFAMQQQQNQQKPIQQKPKQQKPKQPPVFVPSDTFKGVQKGYTFKNGPNGNGYYMDK